jgi:hypothetical protein
MTRTALIIFSVLIIIVPSILLSESTQALLFIKDYPVAIELGKPFTIIWEIRGGGNVTHTDIHWAYLDDMKKPSQINNLYRYPYKIEGVAGEAGKYSCELVVNEYKLPAIMLSIHAIVDKQDYFIGPYPIDIIPQR